MKKLSAIITAGGSGNRFGGKIKKQYINILKKPILIWTLIPFVESNIFNQIILTIPEDDLLYTENLINKYSLNNIQIVSGGSSRKESVLKGLLACDPDTDFVFIHDGVRPLITSQDIMALLNETNYSEAIIPAKKLTNTIKLINKGYVEKTIDRTQLVEVYTPQVFSYSLILKYHFLSKNIDFDFTDDASLLEYYNIPVSIYLVDKYNIKVTVQEDLLLLNTLLKKK